MIAAAAMEFPGRLARGTRRTLLLLIKDVPFVGGGGGGGGEGGGGGAEGPHVDDGHSDRRGGHRSRGCRELKI